MLGATSPRSSRALDVAAVALLSGCALAFLVRTRPTLDAGRIGFVAGAALLAGATALAANDVGRAVIEITCAGSVLMIASIHRARTGILTFAPLRYVGRISYGVYLWHLPILFVLKAPVVIEMAAVFAVSMVSYHLLEAPILRRYGRTRVPMARPTPARVYRT